MIDFESFENFESKKIKKISFIFLINFEVMNGPEIIIIDLINRFFSHRFDFYSQSKVFINQSKTMLFIEKNIIRA